MGGSPRTTAGSGICRRGGLRLWLAAALLAVAGARDAAAQAYGQWWWELSPVYRQSAIRQTSGGVEGRRYDERAFSIDFGVNGYLGHPALGSFRLGVDLGKSRYTVFDRDESYTALGYSLRLGLLPRSAYPVSLFFRRGSYDRANDAGPAFGLVDPKSSTNLVASVQANRGFLTGLAAGVDLNTYEYADPSAGTDTRDHQFLQWVRRLGRFDNRVRVDRDASRYSYVGQSSELLRATVDQTARVNGSWASTLSANAYRSRTDFDGGRSTSTDDARLTWRMERPVLRRDLFVFALEGALQRSEDQPFGTAFGATVSYQYRPSGHVQISPFVQYYSLDVAETRSTSPRAGVDAFYTTSRGALDVQAGLAGSWGTVSSRSSSTRSDDGQVAASARLNLGYGSASVVRGDVETEWGRNDFRFQRQDAPTGTALPLPPDALAIEDYLRFRARVHRQRARFRISGWGEWARYTSADVAERSNDRTRVTGVADLGYGRLSLTGSYSRTTGTQASWGDFEQRSRSLLAGLSLGRSLGLSASYRSDYQSSRLYDTYDVDRLEAGLYVRAGRLDLSATAFQSRDRFSQGSATRHESRGIYLSIRRDFAGWLPIATAVGARRRGDIR